MQKIVRRWGLLVLCGLSVFSRADPLINNWGKQELVIFDAVKNQTPDSTKQSSQLEMRKGLRRLQESDAVSMDKLSAKAQLAWVTQQQPELINARDFILTPDFSQVAQGWSIQGRQYVWQGPLGRQSALNLNLSTVIAKQPFKLKDYDEIWIDYTPLSGIKQCNIQFQFKALLQPHDKKEPPKTVLWHTGNNFDLKVLWMLDSSNATFRSKDIFNLVWDALKLATDEDWSIVKNQKYALVQRRMHLKMDSVNHALEIALAANQGVERVNLLVSREDGHGGGELIEFAGLSTDSTLQDGRPGVLLDLRDALVKRFPMDWEKNSKGTEKNSFYIKEVHLFFPGDVQTVAASKPVRTLALLGVADKSVQEFQVITSQVKGINPSQPSGWENYNPRLTVDLKKIPLMGEVDFMQASLSLYSPKDTASCAVRINAIRAVNIYNNQVPAFANNLEGWVLGRGGPFVRLLPEQGQVEQPRIVNFLPMSTFLVDEKTRLNTLKYLLIGSQEVELQKKLLGTNKPLPDFRVLNEFGKDVALEHKKISINNGATLAFHGMEPTISRDGENLVLMGNFDSLEITWPMATRLFENTWFYFGVSEGAERISYLTLTAEFADGQQTLMGVEPNKPFRIGSGRAQLTKLRLSSKINYGSFPIKLRELVLFSPKIATYGEALTLPLPIAMNVKLKPTLTEGNQRLVESGPGYALGLLGNEPVRLVTTLDKQLDWVQGFDLGFRFPSINNDVKCPLTMQLNWTNSQTLHQFCPKNTEGSIFLPLANLLADENKGRNFGALKSIEWIVNESAMRSGAGQEAFSLYFSASGWAMVSAMDQVRLSPVIRGGNKEVYADITNFKNDFSDSYSKRFWLTLGSVALKDIATIKGDIFPVNHPLFKLNQIVAESKQPLDMPRLLTFFDPPAPNSPPRWPKLLLWGSVMAMVWAAWKKGWWSIAGLGRFSLRICQVLFGLAQIAIQMRLLRLLLPWLNLMVGVLVLGPGLWLAGSLGASIQGGMVLSGSLLVILGVYSHWRGATYRFLHEKGGFVLALSAGCAIWSLGHFGLKRDAALGFLPLMGATYALLPLLYQRLLLWWQHKRHPFLLAVWAALTLALYGTGLILKMGNGENYFFTFGGIAVMMVVRELFLVAEPSFRRALPNIANPVYGGAGSLYFSGALVLLVGTATMLSLKFEPIAERLAVVVYYCLVVGTVLKIAALRRNQDGH